MAIFDLFSGKAQNDLSDLDRLVEFKDKIEIRYINLAEEVENMVGFKVDSVSKNGIEEKYLRTIDPDLIDV
ncbi:MAG: hypothetical protein MI921_10040 [Cytophagales bacterium]|nr:hypothetical protein [Cytophagales bacterium]